MILLKSNLENSRCVSKYGCAAPLVFASFSLIFVVKIVKMSLKLNVVLRLYGIDINACLGRRGACDASLALCRTLKKSIIQLSNFLSRSPKRVCNAARGGFL